mmetsp:Transcript_36442/g.65152  ORF Transcript_36442/g.65152 Transcript_36442/m.65152 type:complete len:96 (-) Transcript_36442:239-526(-)
MAGPSQVRNNRPTSAQMLHDAKLGGSASQHTTSQLHTILEERSGSSRPPPIPLIFLILAPVRASWKSTTATNANSRCFGLAGTTRTLGASSPGQG